MSRLLSPQEQVLLQMDTDYLNAGIPEGGSWVLYWEPSGMWVLIFHSASAGYIASDISDLGAARIDALARQSDLHGFWYYLPWSIVEIVSEDTEAVMAAARAAGRTTAEAMAAGGAAIGNTLGNALGPIASALSVPLVIGVALAAVYLAKKKG
jgi:hypothetical protein